MTRAYGRLVIVLALMMIVLGFGILFKASGAVGYVLGALFICLGTARIYLQLRLGRGS